MLSRVLVVDLKS